ncbi:hypothetical protein MLD38_011350 [Melastoma candidum]|uniref:Uncharacterized protein n=1 Tax=Melastoma candidum TaxID=119954 RepID=A0ACB9R2E2_9MYRT|nr:hypothetical protein MLD38_011350 [Melastoma candidum]
MFPQCDLGRILQSDSFFGHANISSAQLGLHSGSCWKALVCLLGVLMLLITASVLEEAFVYWDASHVGPFDVSNDSYAALMELGNQAMCQA